ncbi:MAG: hypothetical protein ACO3EV_07010, partial [Ilumatobacteraceae bacterium]
RCHLASRTSRNAAPHGDDHVAGVRLDAPQCRRRNQRANNIAHVAVPGGVVAYRSELRRKGGVFAVAGAGIVAALGGVLMLLPGRVTGVVGFALIVAACPLLVAFGVPITSSVGTIAIGVALSLVSWLVLGQWAAYRATKRPVADWRDWRSVMWPLALAMIIGGFAGFALFALSVL